MIRTACFLTALLGAVATAGCGPKRGVGFDDYKVHSQSDPKPVDDDAEWEALRRERGAEKTVWIVE